MSLISRTGRRSLRARALLSSIYLLLACGAVTMLYPFGLMIAGSTKSAVDAPTMTLLPGFLRDETALWRKHVEGLFNESPQAMRETFHVDAASFATLRLPDAPEAALVEEWMRFLDREMPMGSYALGYLEASVSRTIPHQLRGLKASLAERSGGSLDRLNEMLDTEFLNWASIYVVKEEYLLRRQVPGRSPLDAALQAYKRSQPQGDRYYFSPEGFFIWRYLKATYGHDIAAYNQTHGTDFASWHEVHLDRRYPEGESRTALEREDWEQFVRHVVSPLWIRIDSAATPEYLAMLRAKYGHIDVLNRTYGTSHVAFEDVHLTEVAPDGGVALSDWDAFVQGWKDPHTGTMHLAPVAALRVHSTDLEFRDALRERYGELSVLNNALGTRYDRWESIRPPQAQAHLSMFRARAGELRWEFLTRNYRTVLDSVLIRGRAVFNTVVYCSLSVFGAILVNPLAAYALSRYRPPSAYKILLLLMLTMAFPPMVTQIPVFIMLRQLDLLNTFWALVLPGLASGYSIFLLKGFFDSLPRELYESAALDGAGEMRMFWQFTMALSKPILSVIALNAFVAAYSNFIFALLICQDPSMWTLMVWLFDLQTRSGSGVVYAALIIGAVPTLVMFILCQRVIMRGIVVPVEK